MKPLGSRLEAYLRARSGTKELENSDLAAMRSDASVTLVRRQFFDELSELKDPVAIFSDIHNSVDVVIAEQDDVVGCHPALAHLVDNAQVTQVSSNHDLEGDEIRDQLIYLIKENE